MGDSSTDEQSPDGQRGVNGGLRAVAVIARDIHRAYRDWRAPDGD